jgi:hypothetical protein
MKPHLLMTGAAVAALVAGAASATIHKPHHRSGSTSAGMYAAPSQPIPYAELDGYLAAKPSERASMGDPGAPMPQGSASVSSTDTSMSPPPSPNPEPNPGAGDQMGGQNSGMSGSGSGMNATGAKPGDSGMTGQSPPESPATTQGAPDGSSPPPK